MATENLFLNLVLPGLINRRSERVQVLYNYAWMIIPGDVTVEGLEVRGQGVADQWRITVDHATTTVSLTELLDRSFHAGDVLATGVTIRHRRRLDADPNVEVVDASAGPLMRVEESYGPPIPGLSNPPDPNPEAIYPTPPKRWMIRLDDVVAEDIREIWIGDYHLTGQAQATADISLAEPYIDIVGAVSMQEMRADIGDTPLADHIVGDVGLLLDCMNKSGSMLERLDAIKVRARIGADVQDLRFLDFYLAEVPWLSLTGLGHIDLDVGLDAGEFVSGSKFNADFPNLVVRVLKNEVIGSGVVDANVLVGPDGLPQTRLTVAFDNFAIRPDGSSESLVEGSGFQLTAESPDVALNEPFSSVNVVVDLPESKIPNFALYNVFLPTEIGISLREGVGTVAGHFYASSLDSRASGTLDISGDEVKVQLATNVLTGDLKIHGQLVDGHLDTGRYDLSGSTVALTHVGLVNHARKDALDGKRSWYAKLVVESGVVNVGAPIYLDTRLKVQCKDSVPFTRLFTDKRSLPSWAQKRLSVPYLSGAARVQVGNDRLTVSPCRIKSGSYQVDLRYYRTGTSARGELLLAAGPLSVGVALRPSGPQLQLFGAEKWFAKAGHASSK